MMRRTLVSTALLLASFSVAAHAADAPVFKPLTSQPNMVAKPAAPVAPSSFTPLDAPPAVAPKAPAYSGNLPVSRSGEVIDSVGGGAIPSLPLEVEKQNGITYLSGGIGDEEAAQLKAQEGAYNLRVLITGQSGEFLTDITFNLKDAKGATLLSIKDAGPYVYLTVPSASYSVEAVAPTGNGKKFDVKVPASGAIKTQLKL